MIAQQKTIAGEESVQALDRAEKIIWTWALVLSFLFLFGWPLLALAAGVFSEVVLPPIYVHHALS